MPITLASMSISGPPELASPSVRGMSTANERAVGQRTEYRCQQPGVSIVECFWSK
jgi:hypothetical protein